MEIIRSGEERHAKVFGNYQNSMIGASICLGLGLALSLVITVQANFFTSNHVLPHKETHTQINAFQPNSDPLKQDSIRIVAMDEHSLTLELSTPMPQVVQAVSDGWALSGTYN